VSLAQPQLRYTFGPLRGATDPKAVLRHLSKPVFTVLRWQLAGTTALALVALLAAGAHGALSAAAGGAVSIAAGLASAWVASRSGTRGAASVLSGALRAEAVKLALAVLLMWLVLTNYREAVIGAFLATFVVTMLIFAMAFFVRDY
jgi:ATP synthase protein I